MANVTTEMDAPWRIQLLGGLRAEQGDRVVTRFRTQKAAALLAYVAYYPERTHPRELLVEILWPDCDVEVGRRRLSVALSLLRQQLPLPIGSGEDLFLADHFAIRLNPTAATTDVARFHSALHAAAETSIAMDRTRLLADAAECYRGELLVGYYEDWIPSERSRCEELFLQALHQLVACLEQEGGYDRALPYALRAVSVDPMREEAHRDLMRLYAAAGQPAAALRQYREMERLLKQELEESPSNTSRQLAEEIRRTGDERPTTNDQRSDAIPSVSERSSSVVGRSSPLHPTPYTLHPGLESPGGAVPLGSPFYVIRSTDEAFQAAIARQDSIVLVKGAQGVGKTSLLARGLQRARQEGFRVALTDLEKLTAAHLASAEQFFLTLAEGIADQLEPEVAPDAFWSPRRLPTVNLERYLAREVLAKSPDPIVWGLDGVDRLFEYDFGSEAFRLFRSWHNERALDPAGPWARLTLAIAYATEAHLFIKDLNKSPFNVGTRLALEDFSPEEVADLNRRCGSPLAGEAEVTRFYRLVGGHPYLVRRGLHELASRGLGIADLEARAADDDGIFGDPLQCLHTVLARDTELCEVMRGVLQGQPCPTPASFYRLRSAGIVTGDSARDVRPRCPLYATYLERHLL